MIHHVVGVILGERNTKINTIAHPQRRDERQRSWDMKLERYVGVSMIVITYLVKEIELGPFNPREFSSKGNNYQISVLGEHLRQQRG